MKNKTAKPLIDIDPMRYPVGKHEKPDVVTEEMIKEYIYVIENFPADLTDTVAHFTEEKLNTPYRPSGWTVRQVVHHCADSHMMALTRFKLALTEDKPVVKPYMEAAWAELADGCTIPIEPSLRMLEALHYRWTILLKSLKPEDLKRTFFHPEHQREFTLEEALAQYAWHCRHHLAHVSLV